MRSTRVGQDEDEVLDGLSPAASGRKAPRRWAIAVLCGLIALVPLTVLGVLAAIKSNVNDVRDWLPAHFAETGQYRQFKAWFGSDEFVIVSWPGCTLDDPRLEQLAANLRERSSARQQHGDPPLFTRVTTGHELVEELATERAGLSSDEAVSRLQGTLIGPDGRLTCAVVTLSDAAREDLRGVLTEIRSAAAELGLAAKEIHLGGPAVVNDAIDRSSTESLVWKLPCTTISRTTARIGSNSRGLPSCSCSKRAELPVHSCRRCAALRSCAIASSAIWSGLVVASTEMSPAISCGSVNAARNSGQISRRASEMTPCSVARRASLARSVCSSAWHNTTRNSAPSWRARCCTRARSS